MFQCCKQFWSCLPLRTATCLHYLAHYALLPTPAYLKCNKVNARLMALALCLALDPIFRIHPRKTLLNPVIFLKPNWKPSSPHSTSAPVVLPPSTQLLLQYRSASCVCKWIEFIVFTFLLQIMLCVICISKTALHMHRIWQLSHSLCPWPQQSNNFTGNWLMVIYH